MKSEVTSNFINCSEIEATTLASTESSRKSSTSLSKYFQFPMQTEVNSKPLEIHLPVEPVICIARVRVGIIAAEIVASLGILQNTKLSEDVGKQIWWKTR